MRITFALPTPNLSGGVKVVFDYGRFLAERGHVVTVVHPAPARPTLKQRAKALLHGLLQPEYRRPAKSGTQLGGVHTVEGASSTRLQETDFPDADIVIATWWETGEWIDPLPETKGRKVHFVQGHEVFPHLPVNRVRAVYGKPWPKITVSNWLLSICQTEYPGGDLHNVRNGVDLARFCGSVRHPEAPPIVGMLWSPSKVKNCAMGLDALIALRSRMPDLRVRMFGGSPPPLKVQRLDWITFEHRPPQDAIPGIYAACNLWLFPSESEGFGLPLLEAMAMGTPVVATSAGAAPDLVDGCNGILVDCTAAAMTDGMATILAEPADTWRERAAAARRTAEANGFEKAACEFEAALEAIAGRP